MTHIDIAPEPTADEREAIRKALAAIGMIEPDRPAANPPVEQSRR